MKNPLIVILLLFSVLILNAQDIVVQDDIYYDTNGKKMNGKYEFTTKEKNRLIVHYKNGLLHGGYFLTNDAGILLEQKFFLNNKRHGIWEFRNSQGLLKSMMEYDNGKKNGVWYIMNEDGKIKHEMMYQEGEKVGLWKTFDNEGNLISIKNYQTVTNILH